MRKHTILCINDEENILSALKRVFLGKDDYEIITANGGEEGLEILRKKPIDLIITDLYMPGIDGWKLCRLLRSPELSEYNNIPILVMSATFSGSDAEEITRDLGANAFIAVPYHSKDLLCAVENLLSGKISSRTLQVLIVEDDESLRRTICECFKECGYSIFEASDGNQALNLLKNVNPEIIILDYHLPDHTGDTLIKRLKSLHSQAAVLVITGDSSPDLAIKVAKMGADGYVRKPFKPQYLIDLCEKIRREWSLLRVEKLLEDRTLEFQRIFENSVDGIMTFDASGCIVQVNNAVEKMLGCGREKVAGKYIWELVPEDGENNKKTKQLMRDLKKQDKISGVEHLWKRNDGSLFHVELNFSVVRDAGRNITGTVASIREITERKNFEKEVKATKDFLANVIESSKDGILVVDENGYVISSNTALEQMSRFSKKDIVGKHASALVVNDKEMKENILKKTGELFEKGFATYEAKYKTKDGEYIDVGCTSSMIKNEKGDYIAGVSIIRDISERKRFEHTLKQSEERYHDLIESANVGIIVAEDEKITNVNKRAEEIYGYTKEELMNQSPRILTPEQYREKYQKVRDEIVTYSKSKRAIFEEEGIKKDGTIFPIEISFSLTRNESKTIIAVIRDLTEKKRSEKEIREAKEFLENLFKTSTDAIMVTDPQGNITMVNDAMEKIVGYSMDDLLGKHTSIFTPPDEKIKSDALRNMEILFREGKIYGHESVWQTKDGQHISVELNLSLLKDKDGNVVGGVNFIRDVTRRKQMEQQLLQSEKLKSLGELAGGVAHDFNNVLAIILGRAQLLKINIGLPPDTEERRKSVLELKKGLELIEKASLDGAETVRRIQEFSRRRNDDKYFTSVDMNKIIDDALEFTKLQWKNGAESKGITIHINKELSTLPSVSGSAAELREVLTNLITNAIFAMPQGGTITVKTFKKGSYACIKVKDTGIGIPEAVRNRIFDPFFTTKGPQSSGLGMSVSYGIIERHRGTILVDSVEGKGTTFIIEIPFSEKTVEEGKVVPISRGQKKVNILIIEDEEDVRNLLKDILTHEGHRVETASNGKLGIEKFKKKNFDMVFTDLGMPGMSGWQVAEKIKAINGKVPIVLITGWSIDLNESEMKEKGIDFIIKKPYKLDQLVNVVQEGMILRERFDAG